MNKNPDSEIEKQVAEDYRRQGFTVIQNPGHEQLPFDLGGYRPDLIAQRAADENYIIEVKSSASRLSVEKYTEIAEIVSAHPGWKFLLVTREDISDAATNSSLQVAPWDVIQKRLKQSSVSQLNGMPEAGLLYAWSILEAAMRRRASDAQIPVERLGTLPLINHLYSLGEIAVDKYAGLKELFGVRNKVAHGLEGKQVAKDTEKLFQLTTELVSTWSGSAHK